jgi:hypothetical protein
MSVTAPDSTSQADRADGAGVFHHASNPAAITADVAAAAAMNWVSATRLSARVFRRPVLREECHKAWCRKRTGPSL